MQKKLRRTETGVVPLAGTWIETPFKNLEARLAKSFPLRERGLKRFGQNANRNSCGVVPLAGTWIETAPFP